MDMTREAIEKIESMAENKVYSIGGRDYSDNALHLIQPPIYYPQAIKVHGLESLTSIIKAEIERHNAPVFVEVEDFDKVVAFDTYGERFERNTLYTATSPIPEYKFGWKPYDDAMIAFRSQFEKTEDIDYILDLLGSIKDENSVKSEDNGLSQTVEVKQGIALVGKANVRPIVKLKPFRTFMEIEQPESEFLLRLGEGGKIGLFEADGGMWKLRAKKDIAWHLKIGLKDLIDAQKVIVMY